VLRSWRWKILCQVYNRGVRFSTTAKKLRFDGAIRVQRNNGRIISTVVLSAYIPLP
jgi:hypothetical protein